MRLMQLEIARRASWRAKTEPEFSGRIRVDNDSGEIAINLSEAACRRIIEEAAAGIKEFAGQTARWMESEAASLTLDAPDTKVLR